CPPLAALPHHGGKNQVCPAVAARRRRPMAKPARRPELIVATLVGFTRNLDAGDPAPRAEPQEVWVGGALLGPEWRRRSGRDEHRGEKERSTVHQRLTGLP